MASTLAIVTQHDAAHYRCAINNFVADEFLRRLPPNLTSIICGIREICDSPSRDFCRLASLQDQCHSLADTDAHAAEGIAAARMM
jgi:hypothetical protein